jgi:UDP-hydrolysing UDP-N-acetyl-D-glucosamine 2-epimerase
LPKRKICVVVASRANYARIKSVLRAVQEHPALELQLIVAASALLERFGTALDVIEQDGFKPDANVRLIIEGENPATMAKSTGLGLLELPTLFEMLEPDLVVTVADRFETISTAIAAAYMNIPVVHTQGGEVSGSIDESVRHAVTKLAHVHFPATELSRQRVIAMGEDPSFVFNLGCPSIDLVAQTDLRTRADVLQELDAHGVGSHVDPTRPYLLMMQHPVTTEFGASFDQINETLDAVAAVGMQALVFWPNVDAGSEQVSKGIRLFREKGRANGFHFFRNLPAETFVRLMAHADVMVGNSSAGLREGAFLGVPVVTVGTRQRNRERGHNVIEVDHDAATIADAIRTQLDRGPYGSDHRFGSGTAGERIAEVLATVEPTIQKVLRFSDPELSAAPEEPAAAR